MARYFKLSRSIEPRIVWGVRFEPPNRWINLKADGKEQDLGILPQGEAYAEQRLRCGDWIEFFPIQVEWDGEPLW